MSVVPAINWVDDAIKGFDPQTHGWEPWPKQALAEELSMQARLLLFGGAAGPGKTEWGIEHCITQCERHAGNRGIIFRRVHPSLNRTITPRAKAKLIPNDRAKWNGQEKTFTFPNNSILEVGHLQHPDDIYDYQGAEFGFIFFEEITEFLQEQVEFLISRLRAPIEGVWAHMISTTNPGGRGHRWVKRWFVKPHVDDFKGEAPQPFHVWTPLPTDEIPKPLSRVFVPATMDDNPTLLQREPDYEDRVNAISNRGLRLAMRTGDWDAIDEVLGALWRYADLDGGRIPHTETYDSISKTNRFRRVVAVDPSDGDEKGDGYGVSVCDRGLDGVAYVLSSDEWRGVTVRTLAEKTVNLYHALGADAIIIERNHGGKWLAEVFRQVDPYANVKEVWASDGKITRAEPVAALFQHQEGQLIPYRAKIVGYLPELEEELTHYTGKPDDPSPNRLDAMVWAITDLMLGRRATRSDTARDRRGSGRR